MFNQDLHIIAVHRVIQILCLFFHWGVDSYLSGTIDTDWENTQSHTADSLFNWSLQLIICIYQL